MKNNRQKKILELIEKYNIDTQEDLLVYLRDAGYQLKSKGRYSRRTIYTTCRFQK